MENTALPWKASVSKPSDMVTVGVPGDTVAAIGSAHEARNRANADLIVHAVNHHTDLVKALDLVLFLVTDDPNYSKEVKAITFAEDILARATRKEDIEPCQHGS